jgi:hypothetical protein
VSDSVITLSIAGKGLPSELASATASSGAGRRRRPLGLVQFERRGLPLSGPRRKHMRFVSTDPVGAWRNGGARALGADGAYAG